MREITNYKNISNNNLFQLYCAEMESGDESESNTEKQISENTISEKPISEQPNVMSTFVSFLKRDNDWALSLMENPEFDIDHTVFDKEEGEWKNLLQLAIENDNEPIAIDLASLSLTPNDMKIAKEKRMNQLIPASIKQLSSQQTYNLDTMIPKYSSHPFYIAVITHGCLLTNSSTTPPSVVPDGMTLSTITATHPGKINYGRASEHQKLMKKACDYLREHTPTDIPFDFLSDLVASASVRLRPKSFHQKDYDQTKGQTRVMTHASGEPFISKSFSGHWSDGDLILVLNYLEGKLGQEEDITFALCETKEDDFKTTTTEILNTLKSKGITNVVMIDFSCSVFTGSFKKMTPLETRALQYDLMSKGHAGGVRTRAQKKSIEYSGLALRKKCPKGSNWNKTSKICIRKRKPITKYIVPVARTKRHSPWDDTSSSIAKRPASKRSTSVKKRKPIINFMVPIAKKTKRNSTKSKTSSW